MERIKRLAGLLLLAVSVACGACAEDDEQDEPDGGGTDEDTGGTDDGSVVGEVYTFVITASKDKSTNPPTYNYVYYSLGDEAELDEATAAATPNWDLRFTASTAITTNSGETAVDLSSGGTGGVAFTGNMDFDVSVKVTSLDFTTEGATDIKPWVTGMGGATQVNTNLMCFPGYDNGDGLTEETAYSDANFSGVGYYTREGMPPVYETTGRIYVIRHGDGEGYSKLEIQQVEYETVDQITTYALQCKAQRIG